MGALFFLTGMRERKPVYVRNLIVNECSGRMAKERVENMLIRRFECFDCELTRV